MDDDEVRLVEAQLRELFAEFGLSWVLAQVDTSVAEGRLEELHHSGTQRYSYPLERIAGAPAKRGKPAVTNRPLSTRERVEYMIDALHRMLVEVQAINKHAWGYLNTGFEGRLPMIHALSFVPDEDSLGEVSTVAAFDETRSPGDVEGISNLLRQLREAIRR